MSGMALRLLPGSPLSLLQVGEIQLARLLEAREAFQGLIDSLAQRCVWHPGQERPQLAAVVIDRHGDWVAPMLSEPLGGADGSEKWGPAAVSKLILVGIVHGY